ncbi:MAG: cation:proton antiporter [Planctomycetota bacterium]|jgi:CPA2 family monovalent cation:H+ antiporter-2
MADWTLLLELVVLLGAALVLGGLFARIGQSPLLGYLLAGMVVGASGDFVESGDDIDAIAELGVTLLLFSLGLEFSWKRLRGLGSKTLLGGVLQVVLTGALVVAVAMAFGLAGNESVAVGAMLALSSTAAVLRMLMDRAEIDSPHGRHAVAILLVQDMAVIPLAVLVSILGMGGTPKETLAEVGKILLMGGGLVVVLYLFVTQVAVRALRALAVERTRELTTLLSVLLGLASAWAAHAAGISPAIGSFLAGMILGASPFATQVRADIASFRIVLLTLFFSAVGMKSDPIWIKDHLPLVLGVSASLILGKSVLIWAVLRVLGTPNRIGAAAGLSLAQIGEFAFVLSGIGIAGGFVTEQTSSLVVSCAIVTLLATPSLVAYGPRIAGLVFRREAAPVASGDSGAVADVVIIGFGPAGRGAARALAGRDRTAVVLDLNRDAIEKAGEFGLTGMVGDATQLDVLEHAGVQRAQLVAITIPSGDMALAALRQVRALAPRVPVIVRSRYARRTQEFSDCGAHAVVGDEEEVGNALGEAVLRTLVDGEAQA